MENQSKDIVVELTELRQKCGMSRIERCSDAESKRMSELLRTGQTLPRGYYYSSESGDRANAVLYREYSSDLTESERAEWIGLKTLRETTIIRKCVVFFTALMVLSLIGGLILALAALL